MLQPKFQASESGGSEEDFRTFFCVFLCLNLGSPDPGLCVGPWGLYLNKLGKGPPGNANNAVTIVSLIGDELCQIILKSMHKCTN